jgi:hypothetical protein
MDRNHQKMLFILGRGRSGTTLLSSLLNGNKEICVAPECLFLMNLAGKYENIHFNTTLIDKFCRDIFLESRIKIWSFNQNQLSEFLRKNIKPGYAFKQAVKLVYSAHAYFSGKHSAVILGDKNPHYALFSSKLFSLFPEAYWIHIIRDPRANIASYKRVRFDYSNTGILAGRWREYNEHILNTELSRTGKYLLIRFEDLLRDTKNNLDNIMKFLNIDVPGHRRISLSVPDHLKSVPWHKKLSGNLLQSSIDEWKTELSPKDIIVTENLCEELMEQFHYQPQALSGNKRNSSWVVIYSCLAKLTVFMEKWLFTFHIELRSFIIAIYRRLTLKGYNFIF